MNGAPPPVSPSVPRRHEPEVRGFASDNHAGVHPEILAALAVAGGGHQPAYGADVYTEHLRELFAARFGRQAITYPVFNGTGANVLALHAMTPRWGAVICAETAHINIDECGALEKVAGVKLLPVPTEDGKLTPDLVEARIAGSGEPHHAQPSVVSITQSTELGTVYTPAEIAALCAHAHDRGLTVYADGARLANAAAALDVPLREFTTDAGLDVISFGGTKNGMMFGEAVVVLDPGAVAGTEFLHTTVTQRASKTRFISVQFEALLTDDLWLRNARHANAMAARLHAAVADVPGVTITRPVQSNALFAILPPDVTARLRRRFPFHTWDEHTGEVRWMTAFDTTESDVDTFAAAIRDELGDARRTP